MHLYYCTCVCACTCVYLDLTCSGLIRNQSCVIILIADNMHCSSGDDCPRTTARRDNSTTFWTQEGLCKYYICDFVIFPFSNFPTLLPCIVFLAEFSHSGKSLTDSSWTKQHPKLKDCFLQQLLRVAERTDHLCTATINKNKNFPQCVTS